MAKFKWSYSFSMRIKKYFCSECDNVLVVKRENKIVNSKSPEAIHFDFNTDDGVLRGDVKFIWDVFYCSKCNEDLSHMQIFQYAKNNKSKIKELRQRYKRMIN